MAKTTKEQIEALNVKIGKLEEQKKNIESKIAEAKHKKSVLENKIDLSCIESIKALGLSMEDLMKLAQEKASADADNSEADDGEELSKEFTETNRNNEDMF